MESLLKNDRKSMRVLILYEILKNKSEAYSKKTIWQTFKFVSKILGDDFMSFPDFEHYYIKLEKGECDLDYDERLKDIRRFDKLPKHVFLMIFDKLTEEEKWNFRESALVNRKLIDPFLSECKVLKIEVSEERGWLFFKSKNNEYLVSINYSATSEESGEIKVRRWCMGDATYNGRKIVETMIDDIRSVMGSSKTRLAEVNISSTLPADNSFFEHLKPLLKSQEGVQNLKIQASSSFHFHSILSGLKAKTLESIELGSEVKKMDLSEILELEQMKQAKRVTLSCPNARYPLKNVLNFEEFDGERNSWVSQDVLEIKNESTRTGKMKKFRIHLLRKIAAPRLIELLGPLDSEFNDTADRRHFRIQNSEEFMRMEISSRIITFSRVATIG